MSWEKFDDTQVNTEEKVEGLTEGEMWLEHVDSRDKKTKSCVTNILYAIIFCLFLFICFLAITDAPSPLDTYPSGYGSMSVIPSSFML